MSKLHKRPKARYRTPRGKHRGQIVKVQRSLAGSGGQDTVLIYNRRRSIFLERPLTKDLEAKMSGAYKCYFLAVKLDGSLILKRRVADQNW